jgi:hypothetical protein
MQSIAYASTDTGDYAKSVISRGRCPGLMEISADIDTRLLLPPVTVTTG